MAGVAAAGIGSSQGTQQRRKRSEASSNRSWMIYCCTRAASMAALAVASARCANEAAFDHVVQIESDPSVGTAGDAVVARCRAGIILDAQ